MFVLKLSGKQTKINIHVCYDTAYECRPQLLKYTLGQS